MKAETRKTPKWLPLWQAQAIMQSLPKPEQRNG
jgi:hypothetical protein